MNKFLNASANLLVITLASLTTAQAQSSIVISQVYGGGGNAGARLRNDFVELFNRGTVAADVTGWTVQYASAVGGTWDRVALLGTIQAGQYFLIQLSQGAGGTQGLPTPAVAGGLNLSATAGKVALVRDGTLLTGTSPTGNIIDLVGYGDVSFSEGRPAPELSNTVAAIRARNGCVDTNDNQADFTTGEPVPRNGVTPRSQCVSSSPQISAAGVTNAASFRPGPLAPGEIITIFGMGMGPEALAGAQLTSDRLFVTEAVSGTRVLFDGVPGAIIYSQATQVSAVVPYGVAGRTTTQLQVEYDGRLSNSIVLEVAAATPAIFTQDSSGRGLGAILNQDGQVNSTVIAAAKGSVVVIYGTGGGQTIPAGEDARITTAAGRQAGDVSVRIGGLAAEVLYAGPAPGLVSGVLQVNARIPDSVEAGNQAIEIAIGASRSAAGVVLAVAGQVREAGTGSQIEARLRQLRQERAVADLAELPTDRDGLPPDWLGLVSWNIQVGGTTTMPGSPRPAMVRNALAGLFSGTYQFLSAQEIPNSESADLLKTLLPSTGASWTTSFVDTSDSMDNGMWSRSTVTINDYFPLFTTDRRDASGRIVTDESRAAHPPVVAHASIDDFDFTFIGVHLTFADGNTSESMRELENVKGFLDTYFRTPSHDPDVIICGDFNTPSLLSGQSGRSGITLDDAFANDARFQTGERRFAITIHDPTSRSSASGAPASNYDHCVVSADTLEEFIQARRVQTNILTNDPEDPEARLTSDHLPVVAFFKTRGEGISLDLSGKVRPASLAAEY